MKRKILWMLLSFLLVVSLVLASCAEKVVEPVVEEPVVEEPVVEEPVVEEPVVEPPVGVPQYGGTFTIQNWPSEPGNPDIMDGSWMGVHFLQPIQEKPVIGDFEKYGPRGTGEWAFNVVEYIPDQFLTGSILEDWEISLDKMVWHVRSGIYWAIPDHIDWMEPRELTVHDVVADLLYYMESPGTKVLREFIGDIYAIDEDSLVIEFAEYHPLNFYNLTWEDRTGISPPELVEAGAHVWENQVGTGPFMFKEYVVGSYMAYIRNPNWWKTTTIDGVEYQLPFVDELIIPIIIDKSTQLAALRTGTLDHTYRVPAPYWDTLDKTAQIQSVKYTSPEGWAVYLKHDRPPFDNLEVRQAMMIGTDMLAFQDLYGMGPLPIGWHPVYVEYPETIYTPLEKLPPETRILYEYNPELAKQMLADAGYPNGFTVKHMVSAWRPETMDNAALLAYQWAKIGVTLDINAVDTITESRAYHYPHEFAHTYQTTKEIGNPLHTVLSWGVTGAPWNAGAFSSPWFDEMAAKIKLELDLDKRDAMVKEALLFYQTQVPVIPLRPRLEGHYWWPWVRNYWGENYVADYDMHTPFAYAWLDLDLKAEMGY